MKSLKRILTIVLCISMLLSFSACESSDSGSALEDLVESDNSEIVISVGDYYITEREFYYIASYMKDSVIYYYQNMYYNQYGIVPSVEEILKMPYPGNDKLTFADYLKEYSIEVAQQLLVIEKLCKESGLKITNEKDIKEIQDYLVELEYAYGGEDLFDIKLEELGYSKSGIARVQQMYYLSDLLMEYRYGDNGVARIPEETVNKYFLDNYFKYDGSSYQFFTSSDIDKLPDNFKYTDEQIVDYFKKNYVKVNHVLYKTVDSNNKELSKEAKAKKKADAEAALAQIKDGTKTLKDFEKISEDSGFEYTFTYGQMVEPFEKAAFGDWSEESIKLVETEYGYHLMEKVEMSDSDVITAVFGTTTEDGKTKAGMKDTVVANMANADIKKIAESDVEKLNKGELEKYPEATDATKAFYSIAKESFIDKNNTNYSTMIDMIKDAEYGKFVSKELKDGVYVVRKLKFDVKDITSDIYKTIESNFVNEAYWEYVQSFYDTMDINKDLINKIDFVKLPALEDEFYNAMN